MTALSEHKQGGADPVHTPVHMRFTPGADPVVQWFSYREVNCTTTPPWWWWCVVLSPSHDDCAGQTAPSGGRQIRTYLTPLFLRTFHVSITPWKRPNHAAEMGHL